MYCLTYLRVALFLFVMLAMLGIQGLWHSPIAFTQGEEDAWATIEIADISMSAATLTVSLAEGANGGSLYLHFRSIPNGNWIGRDRLSFRGGVVQTRLTNLEAGATYEVHVARDDEIPSPDGLTTVFSTLPPDPYVAGVDIENITTSGAEVVVTIAHPGSGSNMVHVRYRTDDSQPWITLPTVKATSAETIRAPLSGLSPGTRYDVQASLGEEFVPEQTKSSSFTTLLPRVSKIDVEDITTCQATIKVSIEDSGTEANTVYMRYRISAATDLEWETVPSMSVTGDSTMFELLDLKQGTDYTVQVSMEDSFSAGVASAVFTTDALPSIGAVNVASVAERSARVAMTIFDPDGNNITVYMRYKERSAKAWSATQSKDSSNDAGEFVLLGLKPGTEYEVAVSLDQMFETTLTMFFITEDEMPRVSLLMPGQVTRSSVELIVETTNAKERSPIYVQYRSLGNSSWESLRTAVTSSGLARLMLNNLKPDTLYEVEASLDSSFPPQDTLYSTITTEPGPKIVAMDFENITDTMTDVVMTLELVEGKTPVHLRYRVYGAGGWSSALTKSTSNSTVSFRLTEFLPGTEYEVEASLDLNFPSLKTIYHVFETDPAPEVSSLRISSVTESGAKAIVHIARAQPRMTVYLRYRVEGSGVWSRVISKTASSRSATLLIEHLMPATRYEVEASVDATFSNFETSFFTTEAAKPSIAGMLAEDITASSAVISLSTSNSPDRLTVYLRYRKTGSSRWTKADPRTTTASTISFELINLAEDTSYDVEASLESGFPVKSRTQSNFTTKSILRVSDVTVEGITKTDARISIRLLGYYGISTTTHVRYRELPDGEWQYDQMQLEGEESTVLISDLLPDTEYEFQASIDEAFGAPYTQAETFKTAPQEQAVIRPSLPIAMTADAAPREFSFSMPENTSSLEVNSLKIWNSTPAVEMEVSIKEDLKWLFVEPKETMAVSTGTPLIVELKVDASGLGAGIYTGKIEIVGNAENLPLLIPVTLTILARDPDPTPIPTTEPTPFSVDTMLATPFPNPTPSPTPGVANTPEPTNTPPSTATPATRPTVIPLPSSSLDPTSMPLPTSTATSVQTQERNQGVPVLTVAMVVLSAVFFMVAGFSTLLRLVRR